MKNTALDHVMLMPRHVGFDAISRRTSLPVAKADVPAIFVLLQVLAPSAPLADLSNLRDQLPLQYSMSGGFPGPALPLGPFAFGAPQQLQPGPQLLGRGAPFPAAGAPGLGGHMYNGLDSPARWVLVCLCLNRKGNIKEIM